MHRVDGHSHQVRRLGLAFSLNQHEAHGSLGIGRVESPRRQGIEVGSSHLGKHFRAHRRRTGPAAIALAIRIPFHQFLTGGIAAFAERRCRHCFVLLVFKSSLEVCCGKSLRFSAEPVGPSTQPNQTKPRPLDARARPGGHLPPKVDIHTASSAVAFLQCASQRLGRMAACSRRRSVRGVVSLAAPRPERTVAISFHGRSPNGSWRRSFQECQFSTSEPFMNGAYIFIWRQHLDAEVLPPMQQLFRSAFQATTNPFPCGSARHVAPLCARAKCISFQLPPFPLPVMDVFP